jgi:hypothetical protein
LRKGGRGELHRYEREEGNFTETGDGSDVEKKGGGLVTLREWKGVTLESWESR